MFRLNRCPYTFGAIASLYLQLTAGQIPNAVMQNATKIDASYWSANPSNQSQGKQWSRAFSDY